MFSRRRPQGDFNAEVEAHVQLEAERLIAEGRSRSEAQVEARRRFGNITAAQERYHDSNPRLWIDQSFADLRYSLGSMGTAPAFAAIAIVSLALGIGANTAVFSFVDAILLKSLPVRAPEQLRIVQWVQQDLEPVRSHSGYNMTDPHSGQRISGSFSYAAFRQFQQAAPQFSDIVGYAPNEFTVTTGELSDFASGQFVSGNYFAGLGASTVVGRPITAEDDAPGKARVAVITYHFWEKRFGFDPGVIGRSIFVNQVPVTVIGVAGPSFQGLYPGRVLELFLPMAFLPESGRTWYSLTATDNWWVQVFGRLRPGANEGAAAAALRMSIANSIEEYTSGWTPKPPPPQVLLRPGANGVGMLRSYATNPVLILTIVTSLVLLTCCVNLANLLLARSASRRREMAVRLSLGAGRLRLMRQHFTESLLLSCAGGVLGILLANPLLHALLHFLGGTATLGLDARLDARTLTFTCGISVLTALLFGTLPAWRATHVDVNRALKDGGARLTAKLRAGRVLVAAQAAFSLVLLVAAALFVRTLVKLSSVDLGFQADHVLTFQTDPSRNGYHGQQLVDLYARLRRQIEAIPGVESAGMSHHGLIQGHSSNDNFYIPGRALKRPSAYYLRCSDTFLPLMRIPLLLGRNLKPADDSATQRVAVVNETFVKRYLEGVNPIGQTFYFGLQSKSSPRNKPVEIVGVAKDAHYSGVRQPVPPTVYTPYAQYADNLPGMTFVVRTAVRPQSIASAVRAAVASIDRSLPVAELRTEAELIERSLGTERLFAILVSTFGGIAALLAAVGLYGVMAYTVGRRISEIGIRLALGAAPAKIGWLVVRDSLLMVLAGLAIGIPAALSLTKYIEKVLFGIKPNDPVSFLAALILMLLVGGAAAWIPARRAARVDPVIALRYE